MGWELAKFRRFLELAFCALLVANSGCARETQSYEIAGPQIPKSQATVLIYGKSDIDEIDAGIIRASHTSHAALAQFYRWFQHYEHADIPLNDHLLLLSPDARFKTVSGDAVNVAAYQQQASKVPNVWKNAHFVRKVNINVDEKASVRLDADIVFVNRGALEQNNIHAGQLHMHSILGKSEQEKMSNLPKIQEVMMNQYAFGEVDFFRSSYGENRLKSLLHYWLSLIENPDRKPEYFDSVLSEEFRTNFSDNLLTSNEGLRTWLAGPVGEGQAMHYRVRNVKIDSLGENKYSLVAEMDWYGLMNNGDQLSGRVNHVFAVIDDFEKPFATITAFQEDEILPATLRPDEKDKKPRNPQ